MSSISKAAQTHAHPLRARGDDFYPTPVAVTQALLRAEQLPHRIWEPCAGRGAIVEVLRGAGHDVVASDLVDYGIPQQLVRRDFLMELEAPAGIEAVVTNPPFKLANEFVAHALHLAPHVCMFLRLAFLEGKRRAPILDGGQLARVHVFSNRVLMMHRYGWAGQKTTSAIAFAWFVWCREHRGSTTIDRIACEVRR